jgi:hypothetical protein
MSSETLVIEHRPLSRREIDTKERAGLTDSDLPERPPSRGKNANNHQPHGDRLSPPVTELPGQSSQDYVPSHQTWRQSVAVPPATRTREDHTSSSSETCLGAPKNHLLSSIEQISPLPPDYADPKRVPGTDQHIYPRAPISPESHLRYPQLVDFFKQAVDADKFLKHHTSEINYELRLCGSTPTTATASIIIFCTEAIFKHLRSLLNSRHIRRQYQPDRPLVLNRLPFASSRHHLPALAPVIVPFRVVFWREATTPTERRSAMEQVVARGPSFLTMCGSLVKYGDHTSTLGLLIRVDSKLYGLTVDHLFRSQRDEERSTMTNEPSVLSDEHDSESNQADRSWVDDVTYEDLDNDQRVSDNGSSVTSGRSHAEENRDLTLTEHYGVSVTGHKVDSVCQIDPPTPYLDWALIEFGDGYFERPNAFYSEDDPVHAKFFTRLSPAPKTSRVPVFMISGVSGTRKGVMLSSFSYIGGKSGEDLCQAWNLILSDSARKL